MPRHALLFLLLLTTISFPTASSSSCGDAAAVAAAFRYVGNFRLPRGPACRPVQELHLRARNLTGAVSWAALANVSGLRVLDLAGNSLQGGIPGGFWRLPALRRVDLAGNQLGGALRFEPNPRLAFLNLSGNRFSGAVGVDGLAGLETLDLSGNRIRAVPQGLRRMARVERLDLSGNSMDGRFPGDLPPLAGMRFLNISWNNFSGQVDAGVVRKFGSSAFVHAGNASLVFVDNAASQPPPLPPPSASQPPPPPPAAAAGREKKSPRRSIRRRHVVLVVVVVVCGVVSLALVLCLVGCVVCGVRCGKKRGKDEEEKKGAGEEGEEEVVVGATKAAAAAPVVVFERPFMELTLADLAAATSGFGRESQLAERGGRSGAAYRAVLPGDLHVVVRVVEGAVAGVGEDDGAAAAAARFRELARLRHPNILPVLGYCIAGKDKLLLYEYMEKGDLHRWLHELPAGRPDADDTVGGGGGGDPWDVAPEDKKSVGDWPTRHRIALGIARGLAFLHQGWAGSGRAVIHGHLVPTNVLLGDDLEPRISDFGHPSGGSATTASDVYSFGVLALELVTGQAEWDESAVSWARGVIRDRRGLDIVDPRLRDEAAGPEAEREMVECLQVAYLCTANSPEKRPTMQQVVGVLKDIRSSDPASSSSTS